VRGIILAMLRSAQHALKKTLKVMLYAVFAAFAFALAFFFGGNRQYHITDNSGALPVEEPEGLIPYAYADYIGDGDGWTGSEGCEGCEGGT